MFHFPLQTPPQRPDPLLVPDSRLAQLRELWTSFSSRRAAIFSLDLKSEFFLTLSVILYPPLTLLNIRLFCFFVAFNHRCKQFVWFMNASWIWHRLFLELYLRTNLRKNFGYWWMRPSNLVFLFLRLTSGLHLELNLLYLHMKHILIVYIHCGGMQGQNNENCVTV